MCTLLSLHSKVAALLLCSQHAALPMQSLGRYGTTDASMGNREVARKSGCLGH